MKTLVTSAAIAALAAGSAHAGGLDRSGQFLGDLFAEGNVLKFSYGKVTPSVGGTGIAPAVGTYDNVADSYSRMGLSLKADFNEALSFALVLDEPFGVDITYPATGAAAGTTANVETQAITIVGRYKLDNGFSVHGGLRSQSFDGDVSLQGVFLTLNNYNLELEEARETGYLLGAAYERPDIALRVSLTYNSAIDYASTGTESGALTGTSVFEFSTPESWNLEFQTGVAEDTLVFGSIRYAKWADFQIYTTNGALLTDGDDSTSYKIGLARRFSDQFAGSVSITYEAEGDPLTSPLAPTNGLLGISLGGAYDVSDEITISGGVNYSKVGDATPAPDGINAVANFTDNSVFGVGFSVAYKF